MAAQSDLYAVLGVAPSADASTIRAAYRSRARTCHPDAGGDEHAMIQLNEAWHVLGNPTRRAYYDASRSAAAVLPVPPVSRDGTTVLDFGRFQGWSLKEIANEDEDYLDWFSRTPAGRPFQAEIKRVLTERAKLIESLRRPAPTRRFAWRSG